MCTLPRYVVDLGMWWRTPSVCGSMRLATELALAYWPTPDDHHLGNTLDRLELTACPYDAIVIPRKVWHEELSDAVLAARRNAHVGEQRVVIVDLMDENMVCTSRILWHPATLPLTHTLGTHAHAQGKAMLSSKGSARAALPRVIWHTTYLLHLGDRFVHLHLRR